MMTARACCGRSVMRAPRYAWLKGFRTLKRPTGRGALPPGPPGIFRNRRRREWVSRLEPFIGRIPKRAVGLNGGPVGRAVDVDLEHGARRGEIGADHGKSKRGVHPVAPGAAGGLAHDPPPPADGGP